MIIRDEPLRVPREDSPWFRVELDGVVYTFRLPSYGQATPVQDRIAAAQEAADPAGLESAFGALVSLCWADPVLALEYPEDGARVFQELRDAGWTFRTVGEFCKRVVKLIRDEIVAEPEVAGALRFFGDPVVEGLEALRSA